METPSIAITVIFLIIHGLSLIAMITILFEYRHIYQKRQSFLLELHSEQTHRQRVHCYLFMSTYFVITILITLISSLFFLTVS